MAISAKALTEGGLGGSEESGKMSGNFDKFVQGELESFRRTCDADFEKMEILEQVSSRPYHGDPARCLVLMDVVGVQRATPGPDLGLSEVPCCGSLTHCGDDPRVR